MITALGIGFEQQDGQATALYHREPEQPYAQSRADPGSLPNDEAASKLLFLVLPEISKDWKMAAREWNASRTQFAVMSGDRFIAN